MKPLFASGVLVLALLGALVPAAEEADRSSSRVLVELFDRTLDELQQPAARLAVAEGRP